MKLIFGHFSRATGKLRGMGLAGIIGLLLVGTQISSRAASDKMSIRFDAGGLRSLKTGDQELLANGGLSVDHVLLEDWDGAGREGDRKPTQVHVEKEHSSVLQEYAWGRVECSYSVHENRLELKVQVTNTGPSIIKGVSLILGKIRFPGPNKDLQGEMKSNVGAPTILLHDWSGGTLAVCNEDVGRPLYAGLLPSGTERDAFDIMMATRREKRFPPGWLTVPQIDRPIYPATTDHFSLSLRFGPASASEAQLAGDILARFAQTYPFQLRWKDRRPIGSLHLATSEYRLPKNPRGWFNGDKTLDITTPAGRADFQERLMRYADNSIQVLKDMDAQGMIVWDMEGEQYPHATTYIGDPRALPEEIEPLADAFFKKFTDAGLRTGLCLRPSYPVRGLYSDAAWQMQIDDPLFILMEKIAYAKKRWGCTLFYVDSNVIFDPRYKPNDGAGYELRPASLFQELAAQNPDVLLIPEQKDPRYYAYTAPYSELRLGAAGTPEPVRDLYRESFSVIYVPDGPVDKRRRDLVSAVKRGDILMFRAWFPDSFNAQVKAIYQEAQKHP